MKQLLIEIEKILHRIDFKNKKKLSGLRSGNIVHSKIGRGIDFKEVRTYEYGDDTRLIDWNVSSRMGELFIKVFHEENDRLINIFMDVSKSMKPTTSNLDSKFLLGFKFISFVSLLSLFSGDKLNIYLYSNQLDKTYSDLKSKVEIYRALKGIYNFSGELKNTDHLIPYRLLKNRLSRKSITFIISDFAGLSDLQKFFPIHTSHELNAIRIYEPIEKDSSSFDFLDQFFIQNIEHSTNGGFYHSSFEQETDYIKNFFMSNVLNLSTESNFQKELIRYMAKNYG